MNDIYRQTQPSQDMTGHVSGIDLPSKSEPLFALDLYQVASLFDEAALARNRRSLSRYCTKGKLDCQKVETLNGEEWRVDEQSVHRLIAQLREQQRLTHQDMPGQAQPGHQSEMPVNAGLPMPWHDQTMPDTAGQAQPMPAQNINNDQSGQDKTGEAVPEPATIKADERLLMQLERENDLLRDQLEKKDNQIDKKDNQIDDLIERGREDKLLIQNFQRKLGMLEAPESNRPQHPEQNPLPWQSQRQRPSVNNLPDTSRRGML